MSTKRKKILYVITKSNFGGAQRYVYELATGLPEDTYDIVVAFGGSGLLKEKLDSAGIKTRLIQYFERDIQFFTEFKALSELQKLIQEEAPDIVHLNSSKAALLGALAARRCGVKKIISTIHGWPFLEDRWFGWRLIIWCGSWITARLSHQVILVSQNDYAHTHMQHHRKKFSVIRTAVPHIAFLPKAEARAKLFPDEVRTAHEHDTWVVSTGEHIANKNLITALKAVHTHNISHDTKIFFTLMSDGELREQLERYVAKHELQDSVFFTGYVDNVRAYLKAFDIFILPSLKEGMPYGLLEAGAAGLPCIASNVGGIPEIIDHEKNGLLIDPKNTVTLVHALEELITNPAQSARYARSLSENIATHFSLLRMIENTEKLYSESKV